MKNPVDDSLFVDVGRKLSRLYYLGEGIKYRKNEIEKLQEEITRDIKHLEEQGYNTKKIKISILKGWRE